MTKKQIKTYNCNKVKEEKELGCGGSYTRQNTIGHNRTGLCKKGTNYVEEL